MSRLARAIVARLDGVFDDPDLMSFGALSPNARDDIERFARDTLEQRDTRTQDAPFWFAGVGDAAEAVAAHIQGADVADLGGLEGFDIRRDPVKGATVWMMRNNWRSAWIAPRNA